MEWVLQLVGTGLDGQTRSVDILAITRPEGVGEIADLGLTLAEGKQVLARVQQEVVAQQADRHGRLRPQCRSCGGRCHVKDLRPRRIATVFGTQAVRLPRFLCAACDRGETGVTWPSHCRSTPELDRLRAHLSALMTYRVAAGVLRHLLPVDGGMVPETLRSHTLRLGEQLGQAGAIGPAAAASAVAVSLDGTFIRSREDGERHLEVRVGNVETAEGGRQVFGAVTAAGTGIAELIGRALDAVGRTDDTEVTAFTDGCPGLRSILAEAGVPQPPILDWFHIAMRLQHVRQAASGLPADTPGREQARTTIVEQAERLRWRIWNGKARNARLTIERIGKVMPAFKEACDRHTPAGPARKLWRALQDVDRYLRGQSHWLVDYAKRHRAGLRVGTSITEGTANFLVNRRMAKSQQMRWSRRGADLLLRVRCAVYNGTLGSGLGHRFEAMPNQAPLIAMAA